MRTVVTNLHHSHAFQSIGDLLRGRLGVENSEYDSIP